MTTVARKAHRRPQRHVPHEPGDRRPYLHDGRREREGPEFVAKALIKVIAFDDFNADNDPHREHDFGSFERGRSSSGRSTTDLKARVRVRGPNRSQETLRVLTVMLAED
jgi:hypothetical protein